MQSISEYQFQVQKQLDKAAFNEEQARVLLFDARETHRFWTHLGFWLKDGHPAAVLHEISSEEGKRVLTREQGDPSTNELINSIKDECERAARDTAKDFGLLFPDAVREAGIEIDSTSRHPKYTFKQGFIEIEVDDRAYTATILPRDGNKITLGLDIDPMVSRLSGLVDRLFNRTYPSSWPKGFLKTLFNAYTAVARSEDRPPGDDIPLRRVTNRLSKNLNKFAPDEFNVDLAEVIKRDLLRYANYQIDLQHTRFPRQGMLLHGLEDGGYLGLISFKKDS